MALPLLAPVGLMPFRPSALPPTLLRITANKDQDSSREQPSPSYNKPQYKSDVAASDQSFCTIIRNTIARFFRQLDKALVLTSQQWTATPFRLPGNDGGLLAVQNVTRGMTRNAIARSGTMAARKPPAPFCTHGEWGEMEGSVAKARRPACRPSWQRVHARAVGSRYLRGHPVIAGPSFTILQNCPGLPITAQSIRSRVEFGSAIFRYELSRLSGILIGPR
ncbi:hypothetical protein K432DRAFT_388033 [Lepidopterella palustris CBS 459.81]|uniref:Uncharacterized protein n=1 Tax=Lepidopterella palustris CBS 459.81 TaxID=1314670 RepID=A0A8E2ELN3_9PEZI|nr:hypothetical protein K432DRAFT_388033 [Lepidopterella palustris CBS 459.81]